MFTLVNTTKLRAMYMYFGFRYIKTNKEIAKKVTVLTEKIKKFS